MSGKPVLYRHLEKIRQHLVVPAFDRVRVILSGSDQNLRLDLECIVCDELLEWDSSKGWWICSGCGQETTDSEGAELLRACYRGLGEVLGETDDGEETDEGKGVGRWVRKLMGTSER